MKTCNRLGTAIVVAAALSAMGARGGARADTIYTYTGIDYTYPDPPYTISEFVTGTIVLATALGDGIGPTTITSPNLVSFSFSDGLQTISNTTNDFAFNYPSFTDFETNNLGDIVNWNIALGSPVMVTFKPSMTPSILRSGTRGFTPCEGEELHMPGITTALGFGR
jgi:hypothetical protein